jgi:NitT/TauT family transport system substrate-binding protein
VEQVKIGILGTTSDVLFWFAEENGYFEHMRIEPVFERFDSGGRMVTSLAANQIDAGGGTPSVALYNAIARGVKVKMVADRASVGPGQYVMVRQDLADQIKDYADLRGRKIGIIAFGTVAHAEMGRALERGGLTERDVELVEMPYPDQVVALSTGAIDVGLAPEPFPSVAVQRNVANKWLSAPDIRGPQQSATWMFTGQFVEQRPEIARDFMVAYLLGARDYTDAFQKKLPDKLAAGRRIIAERTDLKDPALLESIELDHADPDGRILRESLISDYEWFRQNAGLTETINFDELIDRTYADYAIAVLGPYPR